MRPGLCAPSPSLTSLGERGNPGSLLRGVPSPRDGRTRVPDRRRECLLAGERAWSPFAGQFQPPPRRPRPPRPSPEQDSVVGPRPRSGPNSPQIGLPAVLGGVWGPGNLAGRQGRPPPEPPQRVLTCPAPARRAAGSSCAAPAAKEESAAPAPR